jgi:hypothetical protein
MLDSRDESLTGFVQQSLSGGNILRCPLAHLYFAVENSRLKSNYAIPLRYMHYSTQIALYRATIVALTP